MSYSVGDTLVVLGDWKHMGHPFPIGTVVNVKVYFYLDDTYYVSDTSGKGNWVHEKDLEPYNKNKETMKAMKDAVLKVAKDLAKANNTVTTLEIKNELRRDYPYYFWTQDVVSKYMADFAGDGTFTYTDNGTYRTYSLTTPKQAAITAGPVSKTVKTSLSKVSGKISKKNTKIINTTGAISQATAAGLGSHKGFESVVIVRKSGPVTYTKKDIQGQKKSPMSYMSLYLGKIKNVTVGGITYSVR